MPLATPLSLLDLAPVRNGDTVRDSFAASVALARLAEGAGYRRDRRKSSTSFIRF
jgi:hypothetical protein